MAPAALLLWTLMEGVCAVVTTAEVGELDRSAPAPCADLAAKGGGALTGGGDMEPPRLITYDMETLLSRISASTPS